MSLPQVYRIQLHTFEIKWRRKHSWYFILPPPPKFLTHISDFPAWFIFLNLLMSCSSLVWDFDRVNIGNPPTNCSSSDMSVGATFHIIQLLANYWFRQKLSMPYRPIMSVDRPKNAPSEESRLCSFFWII